MDDVQLGRSTQPARTKDLGAALPPHAFFLVSAVFHYLGPAFAVLLFAQVAELGVAWLRIASAAVVFALWRRPWRLWPNLTARQRYELLALGTVLGLMNACFLPGNRAPAARDGRSHRVFGADRAGGIGRALAA